ncbi:MAG: metallophosphoesterase [Lachnospiraceae bacterium]|nr:metallophosphoesterase [Lachnospiraceae bacterium]
MKILCLADEETKALWDYYDAKRVEGVDLIISCGDLSAAYLEFLVTMTNKPLLYVPGNHDQRYVDHPPGGCINIDGKIHEFNGVRFLGLGGSMKYKDGPYMYTENQMMRRLMGLYPSIMFYNGFDVLVTHAPAKGYGDMNDLPHQGFDCFNKVLKVYEPDYMLHGHVHKTYSSSFERERIHESGTKIINAFESFVLEIDENRYRDNKSIRNFFK